VVFDHTAPALRATNVPLSCRLAGFMASLKLITMEAVFARAALV
jgi:hypothetical protein